MRTEKTRKQLCNLVKYSNIQNALNFIVFSIILAPKSLTINCLLDVEHLNLKTLGKLLSTHHAETVVPVMAVITKLETLNKNYTKLEQQSQLLVLDILRNSKIWLK